MVGVKEGHEVVRYRAEHYLEAIYQLGSNATLSNIAKALGVKPSTARKMLFYLQQQGLVKYGGRKGVLLTAEGVRRVESLNYIHKTLAQFFKAIGVEEKVAEAEAEKLEHLIDRRVVEKIEHVTNLVKALSTFCGLKQPEGL
ncbi:MAG: metal-dependent transcriptional regulator [Pyrobaculum sp.]